MVWGCMATQGVGYACQLDGGLDAALYTQIQLNEFLRNLEYDGLDVESIIFQKHKDPKPRLQPLENGLKSTTLSC